MKLNKLAIACGALFAAGAGGQAFAVDLYVTGASALQISFQKAVAEMCDPAGTRNFYTNANGQSYQCMSRATGASAPFPGVSKILNIYKRNAGGSAFGVFPVAANSATYLTANDVTFTSQTGCTVSGTVSIGGLTWNNNINCPNTGGIAPHAGLSDVEPALFGYTGTQLAPGNPIVAQVFGIPVNDKLYRKLQALQGIPAEAPGVFNPASAPSLTYAQVRSLFTGDYKDWTLVNAGITDAGNGSTAAKVCRRVATSGTQATINALFLNNPCGNGSFKGILPPADNTLDDNGANDAAATGSTVTNVSGLASYFAPTTDGYTVVMNSGAGQVDACLTDADVKGELAIGLLGMERVSGASPSDDADGVADAWHYVKLNGVSPSVANTIASTYDLFAEATFNKRSSGYSVDQNALMAKLPVLMGNPATIVSENLLGLAALHTNGYDPMTQSPVLKGTRFGNTCQPTTLQY